MKTKPIQVYTHASELITGAGIRLKDGRRVVENDLNRIEDGAIVFSNRIEWVGKTKDLPKKYKKNKCKDLKNKHIVIPGLIDCHTHLVFSGDRSDEFAARCTGVSYQEIAQKGGGILKTVQATRNASLNALLGEAQERLDRMKALGVKTVEIKSGYGLSYESELKMLEVIKRLKKKNPDITFQSTFLGAHAIPKDQSRESYIDLIINKMLPEVSKKKLAEACDIFIDEGYYTLQEGKKILEKAKSLGFKVKVHADELANTESASLAVQLQALSADHLLKVSHQGIIDLAQSHTVAVLLPGTALSLKANYAPARKLINAGACVAIATDFNPGTCMSLSLPLMMSLSALYLSLSASEIFAAVTYNAAKALGFEKSKGTLEVGQDADISVFPLKKFEELYYRMGWI